jgi:hypothetical protein
MPVLRRNFVGRVEIFITVKSIAQIKFKLENGSKRTRATRIDGFL